MIRQAMTALVLLPAGASACESMAAMNGAHGACATGHGCGPLSIALMAAVAALGVWVLRSVDKDGAAVKRTGQVVGWTFVVVGLGGFLCGAINYGMKKRTQSCRMESGSPEAAIPSDAKLPPGHPPIGPAKK